MCSAVSLIGVGTLWISSDKLPPIPRLRLPPRHPISMLDARLRLFRRASSTIVRVGSVMVVIDTAVTMLVLALLVLVRLVLRMFLILVGFVLGVLLVLVRLVLRMPLIFVGFVFGVLMVLPLVVIPGPIRMMAFDPVMAVFAPPVSIVPDVSVVEIAVVSAPIRMILGPLGMVPIHPGAIVVMPPIGVAPLMTIVVVAPSARAAAELLPGIGMGLQELLKLGMLLTEMAGGNQVGSGRPTFRLLP